MAKKYNSKAVANYFLNKALAQERSLTHMQLQKLIYFAHGWRLGIKGDPLINERVEAWKYGPVVPSVWHEFKAFGSKPITRCATDFRIVDAGSSSGLDTLDLSDIVTPSIDDDDEEVRKLLDRVWSVYGTWSGIQLSSASHEPGGPWEVTVKKYPDVINQDIDDELIKAHFRAKAKANEEARNKR